MDNLSKYKLLDKKRDKATSVKEMQKTYKGLKS